MANKRVFFIDDDPIILNLIRILLRRTEISFQLFETPDALFNALEHSPAPDLVVSDITMGKMNGFQVLEKVHTHYPAIKCAYCSAYANLEMAIAVNKKDGKNVPVFPYYQKPILMPDLMDFILEVTSR